MGRDIDWLTISDQASSVADDVRRIREHPLVPSRIPVYGYVYDVRSGKLIEIPEATAAGRASQGGVGIGPARDVAGSLPGLPPLTLAVSDLSVEYRPHRW